MITVLCGGVGGVKLVAGLASVLPDPSRLSVVVNTADDCACWGLHVSPDVDTVLYTLSGLASREQGWGIEGDTWSALEMLGRYGLPTWFRIGDRDLATHLARTLWLREGRRLTDVVQALANALGVAPRVLPMCDERVETVVRVPAGRLPFQEYFVARRASDPVLGIEFTGADTARVTPEVADAIRRAALVVIAPSNPLVSVGPILAVPGVRDALVETAAVRLAVSPLVGGRAIKGPTVEMLQGLGMPAEAAAVAGLYREFLDVFVLDVRDRDARASVAAAGRPGRPLAVECADTVMSDEDARRRLAREVLQIAAARGAAVPAPRA
ncbi:MAG TPA: 2-phospho-L-lactate transferase [bacterium]|nr:2-phospho-L-lactate transferase [bacterium]